MRETNTAWRLTAWRLTLPGRLCLILSKWIRYFWLLYQLNFPQSFLFMIQLQFFWWCSRNSQLLQIVIGRNLIRNTTFEQLLVCFIFSRIEMQFRNEQNVLRDFSISSILGFWKKLKQELWVKLYLRFRFHAKEYFQSFLYRPKF